MDSMPVRLCSQRLHQAMPPVLGWRPIPAARLGMSMKILVTGSSGHLGEALVRTLRGMGREVVGLDILAGPFTTMVGSVADRACVERAMAGVGQVFHAATLHKPHVATHARQDF